MNERFPVTGSGAAQSLRPVYTLPRERGQAWVGRRVRDSNPRSSGMKAGVLGQLDEHDMNLHFGCVHARAPGSPAGFLAAHGARPRAHPAGPDLGLGWRWCIGTPEVTDGGASRASAVSFLQGDGRPVPAARLRQVVNEQSGHRPVAARWPRGKQKGPVPFETGPLGSESGGLRLRAILARWESILIAIHAQDVGANSRQGRERTGAHERKPALAGLAADGGDGGFHEGPRRVKKRWGSTAMAAMGRTVKSLY